MTAHAEDSSDKVEGSFTISVENGVFLDIIFEGEVQKITLSASGKSYTKTEIQSISTSSPEVMGAIKYAIKSKISSQIQQSFPNALVLSQTELPTYENQLFHDGYSVELTAGFFDLNESIDASEFINGMLDIASIVNYSFPLTSETGWNNSFLFVLSNDIGYKRTNGKVSGDEISWEVKNGQGLQPTRSAEMALLSNNPTSNPTGNESIEVLFSIDSQLMRKTSLNAVFSMYSVDVSGYQIVPSFLSNTKVLPADALRLFVLSNLTAWDAVYDRCLLPLNNHIVSLLEKSEFNQSLDMVFSWDNATTDDSSEPFDVSMMNDVPPVTGSFTDSDIDFRICSIPSKAVFGLVNAGANVSIASADVNFGGNLDQLTLPYEGELLLPMHVMLNGKNTYTWNRNESINGSFSSSVAEPLSQPLIDSNMTIEVENTDLNLLSFFTGKTELTVGVYCEQRKQVNATYIPASFSLPDKIKIDVLNADAIRLCIDEGVFSSDEVSSYLAKEKHAFENASKEIIPSLKGKGQIDRNRFEDSLAWDGNISQMSSTEPINLYSYMHSSYPLSFQFSVIPPSFNIEVQNVTLAGVSGEQVTYRMLFPSGISVEVNDSLNRVRTQKLNGKTAVFVSFNASEEDLIDVVSISLHPSAWYILGLFVPCIVSVIITLILFIVVYIIRKKRNRIRGVREPIRESGNEKGYQDEEYYVPPPPNQR